MQRIETTKEIKIPSQIKPHHYIIKGLGKFDNMKELRAALGVSRNAIRLLLRVGIIQKID